MRQADYSVQTQWDRHQMMFGVWWSRGTKAFYLGPLAVRWVKVPNLEDFLPDGLTMEEVAKRMTEAGITEHNFEPVEGELGKYECSGCGEVRYDPAVN